MYRKFDVTENLLLDSARLGFTFSRTIDGSVQGIFGPFTSLSSVHMLPFIPFLLGLFDQSLPLIPVPAWGGTAAQSQKAKGSQRQHGH